MYLKIYIYIYIYIQYIHALRRINGTVDVTMASDPDPGSPQDCDVGLEL